MPTNYITLTRQQLYELVWSTPMSTLAKEFGITDSGLAKRCHAVDVPIPYRGYWARKAAGQDPKRLPLPKYRRSGSAASAAETDASPEDPSPVPPERKGPEPKYHFESRPPKTTTPVPAPSVEHVRLDDSLRKAPLAVREDLRGAHASIGRTAVHLKASAAKDFDWRRADRKGPTVSIVVAADSVQRALRVADSVLRAAENVGWPFRQPPKNQDPHRSGYQQNIYGPIWGCVFVEDEPLQITMTERQRQVPHVMTKYEKESRARGYDHHLRPWDLAYTGDLRLIGGGPSGCR